MSFGCEEGNEKPQVWGDLSYLGKKYRNPQSGKKCPTKEGAGPRESSRVLVVVEPSCLPVGGAAWPQGQVSGGAVAVTA